MTLYELSFAGKYLRPSWKNLSVSLISLLSIAVIGLVVWLVVVFFSVTHGLERNWISKVVGLSAPLRITATPAYYRSYFYRIDAYSSASNYMVKNIGEKLSSDVSNPYNVEEDIELPADFPLPDIEEDGSLKDPVKKLFAIVENFRNEEPSLKFNDYLVGNAQLKLSLLRPSESLLTPLEVGALNQNIFLTAFNAENLMQQKLLLPMNPSDWDNVLRAPLYREVDWESDDSQLELISEEQVQNHFSQFFNLVSIKELKSSRSLWPLPPTFRPQSAAWRVCALFSPQDGSLKHIAVAKDATQLSDFSKTLLSRGYKVEQALLTLDGDNAFLHLDSGATIDATKTPLFAEHKASLQVHFQQSCLKAAKRPEQLLFFGKTILQDTPVEGVIPYTHFAIADAEWLKKNSSLDVFFEGHEKIFLPRQFQGAGARIADRGVISYQAPGASALQEQRIDVVVAGFFDPGLIPIGGKFVLAPRSLVEQIANNSFEESPQANGIELRFDSIDKASMLKNKIDKAFMDAGIAPYWHVETFREYEFTKDLLQQLSSERHLFTLLALLIILVACSNIISMLIILVNDKKGEIAILRALGATSGNIALIFGFSGVAMGVMGSAFGITLAVVTLYYLNTIIAWISQLQGYELFNPHFYGTQLPTQLSMEALVFVFVATAAISLLSGLIPAIKAACVKPSEALKSE